MEFVNKLFSVVVVCDVLSSAGVQVQKAARERWGMMDQWVSRGRKGIWVERRVKRESKDHKVS